MKLIKGDVFLPNHGYLPVMAGKSSYAHTVGMWDIWTSNNERAKIMLRYEIYQAIHEKRFGAMILNGNWFKSKRYIRKYYKKPKVVFHDESVFWPITGRRIRPHLIFLPKEQ
jgi:hypothetical protein